MKIDNDKDQRWNSWQEHLDRALKNLPEKTAPSNLIPNVMAEIRTGETGISLIRPFPYGHSELRFSAVILALSLAAYLSFIGGRIYENAVAPALRFASSICRTVLGSLADILGEIPFGIGDEVPRFLFPVLICVMLAMYLTCIGVGTFIYRTVRR